MQSDFENALTNKQSLAEIDLRKYIKFILLFLFAVFIFWFFGRNLDWSEVRQSFQRANAVYIMAAILVICLGYLLRA